ncbi:MAG: DUF4251 domain-containing protein [Rikenellaceae bacterium]
MKRSTFILSSLLIVAVCFVVIGDKSAPSANPKSERRELREARRAEQQAAMEREIDSIVLARAFIFRPQTAQVEPAGRMLMLSNPNFEVRIWDGAADIFIPYISGPIPPYRHTIINYTITRLDGYTAIQTENGWRITFSSGLYTASRFNFDFEINSKFGSTTLTLSNTMNNEVSYSGMITKIY